MKRILSLILCMALITELLPASAFADMNVPEDIKPKEIVTSEGKTVEVEDTWEDQYPYGIVLFANGEAHIKEGGEEAVIPVYRLGGTQGRASAIINYNPVVLRLDEEKLSYETAAGAGDVSISVEDPLPIARYQSVGKPAQPEKSNTKITDSLYDGDDALPGDHVLGLDVNADKWQWYVLSQGEWQVVEDATNETLVVSEDMLDIYDFRCVYTSKGRRYCTDSLKGESYEKQPEETPEKAPDDLELDLTPSYSKLEMDENDPYAGYVFEVTFADGEWVKEIHVSSPEDDKAEAMKFATFTIVDNEGADIMDASAALTLSVEDNEDPDKFTIGFTDELIEADKSAGSAHIRLKRTGGNQTMVTVDYATEDDTAHAGRDYQAVKGTAAFYAGVDEADIEVPLINDATANDEPVYFSLKLGELKGDNKGLCTISCNEIKVSLTNSGRSVSDNFATMMYDGSVVDASRNIITADKAAAADKEIVTGEVKEITDDDLIHGLVDYGFDEGEAQLSAYKYPGRIDFTSGSPELYWSDSAYVAGKSQNDITGWTGGSANGSGWEIKGKSPANALLNIPYMSKMYSGFDGKYEYNAQLADDWSLLFYGMEYVYGWAGVTKSSGHLATASSNPQIESDDVEKEITYYKSGSINTNWDVNDDVTGLGLYLSRYDAHDADKDVYSRLTKGTLTRRVMGGDMYLRIHTANDGESGDGNIISAPEGAAALKSDSGVYDSIKPDISLVPNAGGVNGNGRLYVGSKIKISLKNTDSYRVYPSEDPGIAVYLTDSRGYVNSKPGIEKSGNDYTITMVWDDMTSQEINDSYTINVVMTRRQSIELDMTPSVPRKKGADGKISAEIDTTRIDEAWNDFWNSTSGKENKITIGYTEMGYDSTIFSRQIKEKNIDRSEINGKNESPLFSLGTYENVHYVNFNRNPWDRILYNGKLYNGNEKIWLTVEDLAFSQMSFRYYDEDARTNDSIMSTAISRVELYLDGDGDKKISGKYNPQTGYFVTDKTSGDEFVMMLDKDESYNEVIFQPKPLGGGKFGEYYAKIYYTMTPRSLTPPVDDEGRVQVLPAFTTSVTDQAVYSGLTEEQQSYRYVMPGVDADGKRTSDDHLMYGPEAAAIQFVDVPLGGDHSPVESKEDGNNGYTHSWNPDYHGNLLFSFSNPDPIYIEHSLAGDNIPLADVSVNNNVIQTDKAGRDNINGYLGSFAGDTTIALCVSEQNRTVDSLKDNSEAIEEVQPESTQLIGCSTVPDASYLSQMDSNSMGDMELDPSDSGNTYSELLPGMGSSLPLDLFSMMGYATVLTSSDQVILNISIPVVSFSPDTTGKWQKTTIPSTIKENAKSQFNELKGLMDSIRDEGKLPDSLKQRPGANGGNIKSKKVQVDFGVAFVFNWKYDKITNRFVFKEFGGGGYGNVAFKGTCRFAPCPLIYVYLAVNFELKLTLGGLVQRHEKERDIPYVKADRSEKLNKGGTFGFNTKNKNLNIQFNGKLYIEVLDKENGKPVVNTGKGFIKSDGGIKKTISLSDHYRMEFPKSYYIHIVALEDTTISYLNVIEDFSSEVIWGGVKFTPKLLAEVGLGAGVELLKVEGCIKLKATCTIGFGKFDEETHDRSSEFTFADFLFSITIRAVMFGFKYEMDAFGFGIKYTPQDDWQSYSIVLGKEPELESEDSLIRPIQDTASTQHIYSPQYALNDDEASLMAYDADDPSVPFQMSGYNSSVSAFKISDGLALGYDYQVVNQGGENYVVYTYGREDPEGPADRTMLVLSRIVSTGGTGNVGVVNPLDDIKPTEESTRSDIPYIIVDSDGEGHDDGTGDLEFSAWADTDGRTIHVAWISYADKGGGDGKTDLVRDASKNTVVKTASFDISKKDGFTRARLMNKVSQNRVMLPAVLDDNTAAWVESIPYTDDERNENSNGMSAALKAAGFDPKSSDPSLADIGRYRLLAQEMIWDGYGKQSIICVGINDDTVSDNTLTFKMPLTEGQTVDSIEYTKSKDRYYTAFTTRETCFVDKSGKKRVSPSQAQNILTIKRLFLGSFTALDGAAVMNDNVLLRTLYDYENNDDLEDGIYSGGEVIPYKDPYFSNLKFLNATLGNALSGETEEFSLMSAEDAEDFLLFEMNGCTYVIQQESLESITGDAHKGTIIPFFATDTDLQGEPEAGAELATGKSEVVIGTDSDGSLAAVYTSTVRGTTNNGLFMSKFDPVTGTWGNGVILAMNHMDVYEDAVDSDWDENEISDAYLGELSGYKKGAMDQFTFTAPSIALGTKPDDDTQPTLLIMTQGNMSYLKRETSGEDEYITIDPEGKGKYTAGNGIYVISYGMGQQTIGEAELDFLNNDFSVGAKLHANVSFINTGDVSIRGSKDKDQEITVTLSAAGEGMSDTRLLSWTITENIVPGRKVLLEGDMTLPDTLPEGAHFNLNVNEGSYYEKSGGEPYTATLTDIYTIESMPELKFEETKICLSGADSGVVVPDENGNAVIEIDMMSANRGNTPAEDVYVQFSYDTGESDEEGNPIYAPLDITDNTLTVGEQEPLAELADGNNSDPHKGILYLGSIKNGFGRRVKGTLTLSPDKYFVPEINTLGLRMELFSAADGSVTKNDKGLLIAEHGEYNALNNVHDESITARTGFVVADQLLLPKGGLVRLPIHYYSTTGSLAPNIHVTEYPDKEDQDGDAQVRFTRMEQCLDRLYFEDKGYSKGRGSGTVVIRAKEAGSGYIRILDQNTNSYHDVPFVISGENGGMDITTENGRFEFFNADGSAYKKDGDKTSQSWTFSSNLTDWGTSGSSETAPYGGTLAKGKRDAYITFETEADSIDLFLRGEVEVSSDLPGFETVNAGAHSGVAGEESFARIDFGDNPDNRMHKVKIRVLMTEDHNSKEYALIDRLIEHYSGEDVTQKPNGAPRIYWGQNLPAKASLVNGMYKLVELNVINDVPVSSVRVYGRQGTTVGIHQKKTTNAYWHNYVLSVRYNGVIDIEIYDQRGNCYLQKLNVDWFKGSSKRAYLMDDDDVIPMDKWMSINLVEGDAPYINVSVGEDAPYDDIVIVGGEADKVIDFGISDRELDEKDMDELNMRTGRRGMQAGIPVTSTGLYVVSAFSFDMDSVIEDPDPEYVYNITEPDGTESTYNAKEKVEFNVQFLYVDRLNNETPTPDPEVPDPDPFIPVPDPVIPQVKDTSGLHLQIVSGLENVTITWDDLGAVKYIVYRTDKNGKVISRTVSNKKGCMFIDKKCKGDEQYTYHVEAVFGKNDSRQNVKSDPLTGSLLPVGKVRGISVDTVTEPGVAIIRWDEMEGARKYFVYRIDEKGKARKVKGVRAPRVTVRDKKFRKLKAGRYDYYVVAKVGKRISERSDTCGVSVNGVSR